MVAQQMIPQKPTKILRLVKQDQPTIERYTANLIERWRTADPAWLARGMEWYTEVGAEVRALATAAGVSMEVASGVAAVLSSDNNWKRNRRGLGEALSAHKRGERIPKSAHRYGAVRDKAQAILDGRDPEWVMDNYGKGSNAYKCRRFYRNILGDLDAVTVDRWHWRFCEATRDKQVGVPKGRAYLECEQATVNAAGHFGISPAKFQAGLWTEELREGAY